MPEPEPETEPDPEPETELTLADAEVAAQTLVNHDGHRVWLLDARADGHQLRLESYAEFGGPQAPGRFAIDAREADYATCGLCLVLRTDCADGGSACGATWMPVPDSGAVEFAALGVEEGEALTGAVEGLRLREVTIDPDNYTTTVVPDGAEIALADWAFDASLEVECSGHGHMHGERCHCDPGYQTDPFDPGRCVPA